MTHLKWRQRIRVSLLIISLLLFPITINYLSPYVILYGASQGIINGSMIVFAGLFVSSLVFGRLWCSWICPAGALGEVCQLANGRRMTRKWVNWIKWFI